MANNIFQQQITPIKPKVLESERIYVYVPTATKTTKGAASFNERDFGVNNGHVSLIWSEQLLVEQLSNPLNQVSNIKVLADEFVNTNNVASITNPITGVTYNSNTAEVMLNRRNRDAFVRPDFVMLDSTKDFESSTDENGFVKYTLKRNNPLEQPSLIQVSTEDFVRENGIVKINWTDIEKAVADLETKLQSDIDNIVNNTTKIGDANNSFATKGGTIAAGIDNAVQLGEGENTEAGTFKFRHYTLIDKDGKVYTNSGNAAAITMKLVATEDFVRNLFSTLKSVTLKVVNELPTTGETNIIYMVPIKEASGNSYYDEYLFIEGRWELIGSTKVDLSNIYTKTEVDNLVLDSRKQLVLGAEGVIEEDVYNFTVENAEAYSNFKTNGTKFLVDLNLPVVGNIDTTKMIAITFGDTVYYVYNILRGSDRATIADLAQVDKYNNATGYRFIAEMTFFDNSEFTGFAIIPTISMSDVLSLDSDQMDNYLADGGLTQGQLAICKKVITNGYVEGALYRFDIVYPDSYTWTSLSKSTTITRVTDTDITTTEFKGYTELSEEQFGILVRTGSVEVNGKIITFSEDGEYLTPDTSYSVKIDIIEPATTLEGEVGQFYLDSTNKKLYVCTGKVDSTYEWTAVGSGVSQEDFDKLVNNEIQISTNANGFKMAGAKATSSNAMAIGNNSSANGSFATTVGQSSEADYYATAYGAYAKAKATKAIQFGAGTNSTANSLQIDSDNIYKTDTHTLTVKNIEQNGNKVYGVITGEGVPANTLVGAVGQFYLNTLTSELYQCTAIDISNLTYTWQLLSHEVNQEEFNALDTRVETVETTLTELTPDIMSALKTPMTTPTTTELVAVDNTNAQTMISIGDGLVLENGTIKAEYWEEVIYSANELFKTNTTYNFTKTVGSYETIELELRAGGYNSSYFVKMKTIPSVGSTYIYIPDHDESSLNQIVISFTDTSMTVENSLIELSDYANWVLQKIRWIHR